MTFQWLDLHIEGDLHPRRFDAPSTLETYLRRVERLSSEACAALLRDQQVTPPLARRMYRITLLTPPTSDT